MICDIFTGGVCETNAYLFEANGRRILVDAPDDCADWLQERGVTVDALLLTHQHFDHVMDAARIAGEHGCPIYAWTQPTDELWLSTMFSKMTGWALEIAPYAVTHELEGTSSLTVGGVSFLLLHVPGHSPDSVCFYDATGGRCYCGDTVFAAGVGRTDLPGGSHEQLIRGIREKIYALPDATVLLPGHGDATTVGTEKHENPYVRA